MKYKLYSICFHFFAIVLLQGLIGVVLSKSALASEKTLSSLGYAWYAFFAILIAAMVLVNRTQSFWLKKYKKKRRFFLAHAYYALIALLCSIGIFAATLLCMYNAFSPRFNIDGLKIAAGIISLSFSLCVLFTERRNMKLLAKKIADLNDLSPPRY